jgi:hypothetical protein
MALWPRLALVVIDASKKRYAHSVRKIGRFSTPTASNPFAPLVLLQECRSELVSPVSPLLIFKSMALRIWNLEIIEKKF